MRDSIAERDLPSGEIHLHWLTRPAGSGRQGLKEVLAEYLGVPWRAVRISQTDASSKPFLSDDDDIRFNWSHSARWALVAVGREVEVGVDLEARQRSVRSLPLAERFFADSEFRFLRELPEAKRAAAFLRLWTGKEAVLKALGCGISAGLDRVELAISDSGELQIQRLGLADVPDDPLHLRSLHGPIGHASAALAWSGGQRYIRSFYHGHPLPESAAQAAAWHSTSGI